MSRPTTTRPRAEQREQLQGKIETIFATDAPRGDCEASGGGPSGFPPHVEDFGPSHRHPVIEPTAGGQHRQPRHSRESRQQEGQSHHDHQGDLVGVTSPRGGPPQWGCVERTLGFLSLAAYQKG